MDGMGRILVNMLPSGKRLHNYGKIHHFQWVNPLFLWSFSIDMLNYHRVYTVYMFTSSENNIFHCLNMSFLFKNMMIHQWMEWIGFVVDIFRQRYNIMIYKHLGKLQ